MEEPTIQKMKRVEKSPLEAAIRYYTILSAINNIKLTDREIQLVAFTAIKGNINYATNREEFCKMYNSSSPTINNMISKLRKLGILIKDNNKTKVHPVVLPNFEKDILLQIRLVNG